MVFCRPCDPDVAGAACGHVGWGFEVTPGIFSIGAVEEFDGQPYSPPGDTAFWKIPATDTPTLHFVAPPDPYSPYDLYKEIDVAEPNVDAAKHMVDVVSTQPFYVIGRNCMNSTYDVLSAYGAVLPDPPNIDDWLPINSFSNIPVPQLPLLDKVSSIHIDVSLYQNADIRGPRYLVRDKVRHEIRIPDITQIGLMTIESLIVRGGTITLFENTSFSGRSRTAEAGTVANIDEIDPTSFIATG